jgi:hypothetical protein
VLARFAPTILIAAGVVVGLLGLAVAGLSEGCENNDCGDPTTLRIIISGSGLLLIAAGLVLKWRWRDPWGR